MTKNLNKTGERGANIYTGRKKIVENWQVKKKTHFRDGLFDSGFFAEFRGTCIATSTNKPECEKNLGFSMPV